MSHTSHNPEAMTSLIGIGLFSAAVYYIWNLMVDWESLSGIYSAIAGFYYALIAYPLESLWYNATSGLSLRELQNPNSELSLVVQLSLFIKPIINTIVLFLGYVLVFGALLPRKITKLIWFGPLCIALLGLLFEGVLRVMPHII